MQIKLDELFSDDEFKDIITEKWAKQYQKLGKLQSTKKDAITKTLLKHYETAEYVKGSRSHKAYFEIGIKREQELSNADMINEGIKKSNIADYKLTAYKLFKNYVSKLDDDVTYKSMTRLKWLKQAGITSNLQDFHMLNADKIDDRNAASFIKYYQYDFGLYLKEVLSYCINQLNIQSDELTFCDAAFDDEIENDENGRKKRLLNNEELIAYNDYRNSLKKDENGKDRFKNFYNAPREFKNKLSDYVKENFKSSEIWLEVELNLTDMKFEADENIDVDKLRLQFIQEFQEHRNSLYVRREFKSGKGWRYDNNIVEMMKTKGMPQSVIVPYRQMEERNYFKFMAVLDMQIGFDKADLSEYKKMELEYKATVKSKLVKTKSSEIKQINKSNDSENEMIKSIETKYNGYNFRSRLEARWAVFFDTIGIKYEYEQESFMSEYKYQLKGKTACYLPDFFLPELNIWVEVKGDSKSLKNESNRMSCILSNLLKKHQGIIFLGNVPPVNTNIGHNIFWFNNKEINKGVAVFEKNYIKRIPCNIETMPYFSDISKDYNDFFDCNFQKINFKNDKSTILSYNKARQARFEFGETPKNVVKIDKQIKENKKPDIKKEIKPRKEVRGLTTFYSYSDVDTKMLDFDELFS